MAEGQSTAVSSAIPVGNRFGRLVVRSGPFKSSSGKAGYYLCECDCGTQHTTYGRDLIRGRSKSCGCQSREMTRKRLTKHAHAKIGRVADEYRIWSTMKARCHRTTCKEYPHYGGRGIVVCDRWRESFEAFLADMGPKPSKGHSIDRIDNDGPYSPENCRWATNAEQHRNMRTNRLLTHAGETLCLRDWATRLGVPEALIRGRLRRGWTVEKALTTPSDTRFRRST